MEIEIPKDAAEFIDDLVASGVYKSAQQAIEEGVKLLRGREQLRSELQKGIGELESGQWADEEVVFSEINAEIDDIEATQQGS